MTTNQAAASCNGGSDAPQGIITYDPKDMQRWTMNHINRKGRGRSALCYEESFAHPMYVVVVDIMRNGDKSTNSELRTDELKHLLGMRYKTIVRHGDANVYSELYYNAAFEPFADLFLVLFFNHKYNADNFRAPIFYFSLNHVVTQTLVDLSDELEKTPWSEILNAVKATRNLVPRYPAIPRAYPVEIMMPTEIRCEPIVTMFSSAMFDLRMMLNTTSSSRHGGIAAAKRAKGRFIESGANASKMLCIVPPVVTGATREYLDILCIWASYFAAMCAFAIEEKSTAAFLMQEAKETMLKRYAAPQTLSFYHHFLADGLTISVSLNFDQFFASYYDELERCNAYPDLRKKYELIRHPNKNTQSI